MMNKKSATILTIDLHLACLCRVGAMDVMAVSSQSCLDLSTELESQQQIQVRGVVWPGPG